MVLTGEDGSMQSQCLFVDHKFEMDWPGVKRGPSWREGGD